MRRHFYKFLSDFRLNTSKKNEEIESFYVKEHIVFEMKSTTKIKVSFQIDSLRQLEKVVSIALEAVFLRYQVKDWHFPRLRAISSRLKIFGHGQKSNGPKEREETFEIHFYWLITSGVSDYW